MKKAIMSVCLGLILWDVVTTYYGTLSIFTFGAYGNSGVFAHIFNTELIVHIVSVIFAVALICFILSYKAILRADNKITKPILIIAFIYDFTTSFYGTSEAISMDYNNFAQWAIVLLLAIMTTSAPLLISQIMEMEEEKKRDFG
jgi:hypothetical protein